MSQQNLEGVRRGYEAFNRGDLDQVLEGLDPEIEWHVPPILPEETVYNGHDGVRELWRNLEDAFEKVEIVVEEMFEADDKVVTMAAVRGRGMGSGAEVETPSFGGSGRFVAGRPCAWRSIRTAPRRLLQ